MSVGGDSAVYALDRSPVPPAMASGIGRSGFGILFVVVGGGL